MKKMKEITTYCRANNIKVLVEFDADFWEKYNQNSNLFDAEFNRRFSDFYYFDDLDNKNISDVVNSFHNAVETYLIMNFKRLNELYKIELVQINEQELTETYVMHEETTRTKEMNNELVHGAGNDIESSVNGEKHTTSIDKTYPYESMESVDKDKTDITTNSFTDVRNITTGERTDTGSASESETFSRYAHGDASPSMTKFDILMKDKKFWDIWNFYGMIFTELSNQLLYIGD